MAVRSFRLSDELDAKLSDRAVRTDRSVSYVIVKALEKELGEGRVAADPVSTELPTRGPETEFGASRSRPTPPGAPESRSKPKEPSPEEYVLPKIAKRSNW